MKKIVIVFLLLIMLIPFGVKAKTYELDNLDMEITFSDDWYVFTRDNLENNSDLDYLGVSKEYMETVFENAEAYIDAAPKDFSVEFFLRIRNAEDVNNLSNYSDEDVEELAKEVAKLVETKEYTTYKNDYKYVITRYPDVLDGQTYNIISYYTIVNGKGYTFTLQKIGELTEEEETIMKNIIDTVSYDFDEGYEQEKEKLENEGSNSINWKIIGSHAVIGAFIGGIAGLIISKTSKNKKKNDGKEDRHE